MLLFVRRTYNIRLILIYLGILYRYVSTTSKFRVYNLTTCMVVIRADRYFYALNDLWCGHNKVQYEKKKTTLEAQSALKLVWLSHARACVCVLRPCIQGGSPRFPRMAIRRNVWWPTLYLQLVYYNLIGIRKCPTKMIDKLHTTIVPFVHVPYTKKKI